MSLEVKRIMHYDIVISWSRTDGYCIAKVPDLPVCMADGSTYSEAAANAEIIMREWIESALLDGETHTRTQQWKDVAAIRNELCTRLIDKALQKNINTTTNA